MEEIIEYVLVKYLDEPQGYELIPKSKLQQRLKILKKRFKEDIKFEIIGKIKITEETKDALKRFDIQRLIDRVGVAVERLYSLML